MLSDFGFFVLEEVVVSVAEADTSVNPLSGAAITPRGPFAGMTEGSPSTALVVKLKTHLVKYLLGGTSFVVIGPTPDDGIEFANQPGLRATAKITDDLFELSQMAFLGFFTGSNPRLEMV